LRHFRGGGHRRGRGYSERENKRPIHRENTTKNSREGIPWGKGSPQKKEPHHRCRVTERGSGREKLVLEGGRGAVSGKSQKATSPISRGSTRGSTAFNCKRKDGRKDLNGVPTLLRKKESVVAQISEGEEEAGDRREPHPEVRR